MRPWLDRSVTRRIAHAGLALLWTLASGQVQAATTLADTPVGSASNVPANLMLALSVEFPTGTVAAYKDSTGFDYRVSYLGYFDNTKCYDYDTVRRYFTPTGVAIAAAGSCVDGQGSHWSGNLLNWATMTALDEFRLSLTGGHRSIDTADTTVLLRSQLNNQSNTGNFPDRTVGVGLNSATAAVIGDASYATAARVYLRSAGQGTGFLVSNNPGFVDDGSQINLGTDDDPVYVNAAATTYNAAVRVCVPSQLEVNCNAAHKSADYPNAGRYNKPEGLIQQNFTRIRVGAAGYAFQSGRRAANGVVRALLHDNGPTRYGGNSPRTPNPQTEWDEATGVFIANPDSDHAAGTAPGGRDATLTGAINYLNQFGYDNGYETYDTLADLYWASLAYLMNVPLHADYTAGLSVANSLDTAFPAFGGQLGDPVQYTCQANAIVTIGDSHTWYDTRVPSSAGPLPSSAIRAALPPANGADAALYTSRLGDLPLIETNPAVTMVSLFGAGATQLGSRLEPNTTVDATYNMAGLAYFAHTQDIRSDLSGKQTVDTYTVDVLEPGSYDGTPGKEIYNPTRFNPNCTPSNCGTPSAGPNMYWLAAKYGGFDDVNGNGIPASVLTWHANPSTEANKDLRPDNYFPGNRPDLIQAGLSQIFKKVAETTQSAAGPGVTLTRILTNVVADRTAAPYYSPVSGFPIYTVTYTPVAWSGELAGYLAASTAPGSVNAVPGSPRWSAQAKLDALVKANGATATQYGWDTGRRIITFDGTQGIPFRYPQLSVAQQGVLSLDQVNYLRGDASREGSQFRVRRHVLGDIVHSEPVVVQGALSPRYSDAANPGYAKFRTQQAKRGPVVYVGANDGMLHAFAGDFSVVPTANSVAGGGSELFAYVPSLLFNGPSRRPQVDGLAALSNLTGVSATSYAHHFYVDQTPQVADVDFTYTAASAAAAPPSLSTSANADWRTLLVGGLGKGGRGIYALDITTVPAAIDATSSTAAIEQTLAADKVRWEFTEADMGFSYGKPLIAKTRKYGWVVLMTSGYNNPSGHGHLYVIQAKTGALLETLHTPDTVGSAANPSGLGSATGYTKDIGDNTIEQVYVGDLLGNLWRFDLSGKGAYPPPVLFATLQDPIKGPQPITTAPRIELDVNATGLGSRRWVFVGTGKALDVSDLSDTQQQTMYALRDGDANRPSATSLPLSRSTSRLMPVADLIKGVVINDSDAGWYYDLPGRAGTNGGSERIVVDPDAATGTYTVGWATMTPTADPCALKGKIYAARFSGGQSVLLDGAGNLVSAVTTESAPTKLQQIKLPNGELALLYGQAGSLPQTARMRQGTTSNALKRVNWREVLD